MLEKKPTKPSEEDILEEIDSLAERSDSSIMRSLDAEEPDEEVPPESVKVEYKAAKPKRLEVLREIADDGFNVVLIGAILSTILSFAVVVVSFSPNSPKWLYNSCVSYCVAVPVLLAFLNFRLVFKAWNRNKIKIKSQFSLGIF